MRGRTPPTLVVPPTLGSALCPGPQVLLLISSSERRAGGLAACFHMLQVASVGLDLLDSHLDEQVVVGDTVWSLLRHQLQRGSFYYRRPHSRLHVPFRAHTYRQSVLGANRRGVQPCAIMGERISCSASASLPRFSVLVSHGRLCRVGTCQSQAQPTSGYRQLVPIARPLGQVLFWKVDFSTQEARSDYLVERIQLQCSSRGLLV